MSLSGIQVGSRRFAGKAFGFGVVLLASLGLLTPSGAGAVGCPNEAIREAQTSEALPLGTVGLPDCMALEMVSPARKFLQPAFLPYFSLNGERVGFESLAALGDTSGLQRFDGDRYVATRSADGWVTSGASLPASLAIADGGPTKGGPIDFAPDLGSWTAFGATQSQNLVGIAQLFQGNLGGSVSPRSPLLEAVDNSGQPVHFIVSGLMPTATSADLSASVFRVLARTSYLPGDPTTTGNAENEPGADGNSYLTFMEGGEPQLELLARDVSGTVFGGRCGAHSGGGGRIISPAINQGAISGDGARVFFTTRPGQPFDSVEGKGPPCDTDNQQRVLQRLRTPSGPEITELTPLEPATGDDLYQGASADGSKVFLTTPRDLAASDSDPGSEECSETFGASGGCDLYLYDSTLPPAERLIQVSAGGTGDPSPGQGADVLSSITAVSGDGSHAYFVAQGVLTTDPNPEGDTATAGQPNLYLYERNAQHPAGRTAFVGTLATSDVNALWAVEASFLGDAYAAPLHGPSGEGGDGHVLVFASDAPLTADDADSGHRDAFRYDAEAQTLQRISTAAPGGADNGPFDVEVNPASQKGREPTASTGEQARWASEDGQTVAFLTEEALVPGDEDGKANPYVWKEGELAAIEAESGEPPAVSPSGNAVAFATPVALLPQDADTVKDVYVIRADGGFLTPPAAICDPLQEGSCQGPSSVKPASLANATSAFIAPPEARKQPPRCRKGFVRRRGSCRKKAKNRSQRKRAHRPAGVRR